MLEQEHELKKKKNYHVKPNSNNHEKAKFILITYHNIIWFDTRHYTL